MTDQNPCANGHVDNYLYPLYDVNGIPFATHCCGHCEDYVLAELKKKYRPEMFSGYDQSDVEEPIDDDR